MLRSRPPHTRDMYLLSASFALFFVSIYVPTLAFRSMRAQGVLVISYLACRGVGAHCCGSRF